MTVVAQNSFTTILALPTAKIQSAMAGWSITPTDTTRCFLSLASDEEIAQYPCDDRFIVVRPKDFPFDSGMQAGGGTNTIKVDGTLKIEVWNRLYVDQASRDDQWVTNSTLGICSLIDTVSRALEQWMPTDSSSNYYFIQPMRLIAPGWVFPAKRVGEWGKVESTWSIVWWFA